MDARAKKSIGTMQESFRDLLSVRELSKTVNLSSTHFGQLFKKETGQSPM